MSSTIALDQFDWENTSAEEHLSWAQTACDDQARQLARSYDWSHHPEAVLGWLMAQRSIDLASALTAFFNGMPHRFNYFLKRDVPEEYQGTAQVLDAICLRLNSGFYLVWPDQDLVERDVLLRWLDDQANDRQAGRKGRYILDESIIATLLNDDLRLDRTTETAVYSPTTSLWRDLFSPILELGVSRRMLRYHPQQKDPNDDLDNLRY